MALDRFLIPNAAPQPSDAELKCGLMWLLNRPERDLHIAAPTATLRKTFVDKIEKWLPAIGTPLKKTGAVEFANAILTISVARPSFQARANGACLLVWGQSQEAEAVEQRLGSVGAICVVPYSNTLDDWINDNAPDIVDCVGLMSPEPEPVPPAAPPV